MKLLDQPTKPDAVDLRCDAIERLLDVAMMHIQYFNLPGAERILERVLRIADGLPKKLGSEVHEHSVMSKVRMSADLARKLGKFR